MLFPPQQQLPLAPPLALHPPTLACISDQMIHLFLVLQQDAHLAQVIDDHRVANFALAALQTCLTTLARLGPNNLITPQLQAAMEHAIEVGMAAHNQILLRQINELIRQSENRTAQRIRQSENRMAQLIRQSEERMAHRMAQRADRTTRLINRRTQAIENRLEAVERTTRHLSELIGSITPAMQTFVGRQQM
ncbi:hypothetical protein PGT21_009444 [Puccinia graminis f. sp. tritici]|uniref:Uncharacterized protein n=2 Tax=Puccinia graminis f. sp. tritici TaxID=56615 RepID=E3JWL5_PUCGT|nr:uncharacterized protein PGTG_02881 [Puccinia graminis f. sp. tritici CRL 75-36-700-3]EFP76440.2 hypothetical protein PGTG_02881 [Puccinia graminis f. sp. tritici CRL 75-36-700-3]KAA1079370.1 hypothetical protein PGT21_009444 [Puccinia graminis f. sp. tritici]